MRRRSHPLLRSLAVALAASVAACSSDSRHLDENGKPTLDPTGHEDPVGKADGLKGTSGLPVSADDTDTAVWSVTRDWEDVEPEAGLAWPADSGLNWDQKYRRWVASMEKKDGTFELSTPYGKTLPAPSLECAEVAMFLRIAFASWYHLPFYMEAFNSGQRVFFGHFGIRTHSGRFGSMPRFKARFSDFEHLAERVRRGEVDWPEDAELRTKTLPGSFDSDQPALGPDATAGTYFDEAFLNKRVGYFLRIQLAFLGSINLADTANLWNLEPAGIQPGDVLVERWQAEGIGHTVVVKERTDLGTADIGGKTVPQIDVEVVSGFMPRRQPRWENSVRSRGYATNDLFGGKDHSKFGGGLKRWRSPRNLGGVWHNSVLADDADLFIPKNGTSDSIARLEGRTSEFEDIIVVLSPEERLALLQENVENERSHLRNHPSSCSARIRREEAFAAMYDVGLELGKSREQIDREFRRLEDYVFAELVYSKSKTCCWNSTNRSMYEAIMELTRRDLEAGGSCEATVFMNRDDTGDGYELFRAFASGLPMSVSWVPWSADESCPQAGVAEDTMATSQPTPLCEVLDDVLAN